MITNRGYPRWIAASTDQRDRRDDLEAAYASAVATWREWDRRTVEAQSCDVAVAAQRSLEVVRRLEAWFGQPAGAPLRALLPVS